MIDCVLRHLEIVAFSGTLCRAFCAGLRRTSRSMQRCGSSLSFGD